MSSLDPRALRDTFGRFMTGVTVVTTRDAAGIPVGFTANSFSSVSLDPPLLLVCPGRFLSSFETFSSCDHFCVSLLGEDQREAANTFAGFKGDRFAQVGHYGDCHGIPAISGAIARFSCRTHSTVPAGDHVILIGEVIDFERTEGAGLGYADGQFFSLAKERGERDPAAKANIAGALVRHDGRILLEQTDEGFRLPACRVPERSALRQSLNADLERRGVSASLGPVYSVFEDTEHDTHFAYLLADATGIADDCGLVAALPSDLPGLTFASQPVASMLARYARETEAGSLGFYLGDTAAGETHALTEGL